MNESVTTTGALGSSYTGVIHRLAIGLMTASGFAALGYQIVWTQQSALWLGHESAAILAVVAAFFGGTAVGSLLFASKIDRSEHPARWYAGCEAVIALWSLALALLMAPVANRLLDVIGAEPSAGWHWFVAFVGTFVILLPATAAMGATLPAMERLLSDLQRDGRSVSLLYSANTTGAVLGVLTSAFVLAPTFGFTATALICAGLNALCAIGALVMPRSAMPRAATLRTASEQHRGLLVLGFTGLLGVGYEVVVVRVLSQIAENTIYTFALLLAVYLVGTAGGAAAYAQWMTKMDTTRLRDRLLQTQAGACAIGIVGLVFAPQLKSAAESHWNASLSGALAAEALIAIGAFFIPTLAMGALFSHLATQARRRGTRFGYALGVNTLGAALAPLIFGAILVPMLGTTFALAIIAGGYVALVSIRGWRSRTQWCFAAALLIGVFFVPPLSVIAIPKGSRLVSHVEGAGATVSIREDARGVRTLHINNRQQEGSNATLVADARQGLLPILLHPDPQRALFLGLGTGVTARSAAADRTLAVDVAELLPEVIEASSHFTGASGGAINPRLKIVAADSRRFIRTTRERYDVIVADNFHPARSGSGALYTIEHFAAVRERLTANGLFCQWLPLHQLDLQTLRSIVRSYLHEYPHAWAMLATNSLDTPVIGLVASNDNAPFDLTLLRHRLRSADLPDSPASIGIDDELALLGSFFAGPESLTHFAAGAKLNKDDHPIVMYRAPAITYAPTSTPRDRLFDLLNSVAIEPGELVSFPDRTSSQTLAAYWEARDRYLHAGRDVQPSSDVRVMLARVRQPLLGVLRVSPHFRPAYDPLIGMARALAREDAQAARELLVELHSIVPARTEAGEMLTALTDNTDHQ